MEEENLEEMKERFLKSEIKFCGNEAIKIFYNSESLDIKLKALKLLWEIGRE